MKHKVGDKVCIKSLDWYNKNRNSLGRVKGFMPEMYEYLGKEAIIVKCYECSYELNIDHHFWRWDDEMFDETYNENNMESKKVKIILPKKCEVEKVERILKLIFFAIMTYLIFSFLCLDFNPIKWGFGARLLYILSLCCFNITLKL